MVSVKQASVLALGRGVTSVLRIADRFLYGSHTGMTQAELERDPYRAFAAMRDRGQVLRTVANRGWWILGFDAVQAAFKEPRFSSDIRNNPFAVSVLRAAAGDIPVPVLDEPGMLNLDPPDHTRLRKLAARGFVMRAVNALEPDIRRLVRDCLADVKPGDTVDLVAALAKPLPAIVIAELLGVPDDDRGRFQAWSDAMLGLGQLDDLDASRRASMAAGALRNYLAGVVDRKRREPGQDLISAFILAEEQGDTLTAEEIYSMAALLLNAGHETTTRLIGNGMLALLTHPGELNKLRADPTLMPDAIEEMLRYDPPVQWMPRTALEDFEFFGKRIRRNQVIAVGIASANRDPVANERPDEFEICRAERRHVAFGHGIHLCLGMTLARLEARVAFETVLDRFPDMTLASAPSRYEVNTIVRGVAELPVVA